MSEDLLKEVDDLIRASSLAEAISLIGTIDQKSLKRSSMAQYANLSRRLGNTTDAIKALRPYVRPKAKDPQKPTEEERIEYAMALIKLGALNEGVKIQDSVDGAAHPNKFLYASFAEITRWNYTDAATLLENFVAHPEVDDYAKITAKVNLLSSYIVIDEPEKTVALIDDLLRLTSTEATKRHHRNVLMLAAQFYVLQNDFIKSTKYMNNAIELMGAKSIFDTLMIKKWDLVQRINQKGVDDSVASEISELRSGALGIRNYEMVRDADYLKAIYLQDDKLLEYLYTGTPFTNYREKIVRNFEKFSQKDFPEFSTYRWALSAAGQGPEINQEREDFLNIQTGENSFTDLTLRPHLLSQKFLALITRDFYRPLDLYKVHDELFNETYFSLISTPRKIYQIVYRLNVWFDEADIPIQITSKKNYFSIQATQPLSLVIDRHASVLDSKLVEFCHDIVESCGHNWVSSTQVSEALNLPQRTATKWLKEAFTEELLEKQGAGPKTRFRVAKKS